MQSTAHERFGPVAYLAVQDTPVRERIRGVLEQAGWTVLSQPTGFHLVQSIAGVIEGDRTWLRPGLIAIDAHARGCAGTTIAAGLRELGITIPIVLVGRPRGSMPVRPDRALRIAEPGDAAHAVAELAAGFATPLRADGADVSHTARKEDRHEHAHPVQPWSTPRVAPPLGSAASARRALPGVDPADVDLTFADGRLTIAAGGDT